MSNRTFRSNLSTEGLNKLIGQLKTYEDELDILADEIVQELADRGIRVAEYSVYGDWRPCIEFRYEPKNLGEGELIGEDITLIHRIWYTSKNVNIKRISSKSSNITVLQEKHIMRPSFVHPIFSIPA